MVSQVSAQFLEAIANRVADNLTTLFLETETVVKGRKVKSKKPVLVQQHAAVDKRTKTLKGAMKLTYTSRIIDLKIGETVHISLNGQTMKQRKDNMRKTCSYVKRKVGSSFVVNNGKNGKYVIVERVA